MNIFHMEKKVYRSKRSQFILLFWTILLIGSEILFCVLGILDPGEPLLNKIYGLLIMGILLLLLSAFFISIFINHIEVSSAGVEYYGLVFRMFTPWHNILEVTGIKHPLFPFHITTVFVLRQPALLNVSLEEGKRQRLPVVENFWYLKLFTVTPMNYLWYMPLHRSLVSPFDLEQGDFSAYIRQYAPSLSKR